MEEQSRKAADVRPRVLRYHGRMNAIYDAWVQLMSWMEEYAQGNGLVFDHEADFPEFIYRMHKDWPLKTRVMTVSISSANDEPIFTASVSQPGDKLPHIGLRSPGAHLHWHVHEHGGKLLIDGATELDKERLFKLIDKARNDWMAAV